MSILVPKFSGKRKKNMCGDVKAEDCVEEFDDICSESLEDEKPK